MKGFFLLAIALVSAVGCVSTKKAQAASGVQVTSGAPAWVTTLGASESAPGRIYAVGCGKMSNAANSIKRARIECRARMAEYVSAEVRSRAESFLSDGHVAAFEFDADLFDERISEKSEAVLRGLRDEDMYREEDGTVWVLMSADVSAVDAYVGSAYSDAVEVRKRRAKSASTANSMRSEAIGRL